MHRLAEWTFDPLAARLCRAGKERHLDPKEVAVLAHLIEASPNPVSIDALLERSWPGVIVGDNAVHQVVGRLRKALGDRARAPTYIETLPKRGYRLVILPGTRADVPPSRSETNRRWARWHVWAALAMVTVGVAGTFHWTAAPTLPNVALPSVVVKPFVVHSDDRNLIGGERLERGVGSG